MNTINETHYLEGNPLLHKVARAGALSICILQHESAPELDLGPFPDRDIKGNQALLDELCSTFPSLLRKGIFRPGPQNGNDGCIEVHASNLFNGFFKDPIGARKEWWWSTEREFELLPIEMGTITELAITLKLGAGRGMLRWPYGAPPAVMFWPSAILNPFRYD